MRVLLVTPSAACIAMAALLASFVVAGDADVELFRDDFSRYPAGPLTRPIGKLNAAIQEEFPAPKTHAHRLRHWVLSRMPAAKPTVDSPPG